MGAHNGTVALVPSTSTSGTTAAVKALYGEMNFICRTTTATAGTLDITVEWSPDQTNWAAYSTPDAFTQIAATGMTFLSAVPSRGGWYRFNYTIVTGPFAFEIHLAAFD